MNPLKDKCTDICSDVENADDFLYNETCYFDCMVTEDTKVGHV